MPARKADATVLTALSGDWTAGRRLLDVLVGRLRAMPGPDLIAALGRLDAAGSIEGSLLTNGIAPPPLNRSWRLRARA